MNEKTPKISAPQLFCLMLLSRLSIEIITPASGTAAGENIAALVIAELIRFILALPIIIYACAGENFHLAAFRKNKALGILSAGASAALLIAAAVKTLVSAAAYAENTLFSGESTALILLAAIIFIIYAAYMGIEASARAAAIFLTTAGILTLTVLLADIPFMKISTVFNSEISPQTLFPSVFARLLNGGEYLIFAAFLPNITRKNKASPAASALFFALFSCVIPIIFIAGNSLILRELSMLTKYPLTAAAQLSDVAFFKRLDGIFSAVWSLCAVFRSGLALLAAISAATSLTPRSAPAAEKN